MSDNKELNELLEKADKIHYATENKTVGDDCLDKPSTAKFIMPGEEKVKDNLVQWTTSDNKCFLPASHTIPRLPPGVYEIKHSSSLGLYFEKIPVKTEGLLRFPQTNSDRVVKEIQKFWEKEDIFRQYELTYKRGIILWGPPGSGKSSIIQLIMKDVVDRNGIVIKFINPGMFLEGMRALREIDKHIPVVIMMEDIDSIIKAWDESQVLNILDGVDQVEKIVFLATTNYPEQLGSRIMNRPSRFDKRFKIDHPNAQSRMMYLKHIIGEHKISELKIDLDQWVEDTEKFSIAHLKELFVAVVIFGDDYAEAIETLSSMKELISSEDDKDRFMGFAEERSRKNRPPFHGISGE